MIPSSSPDRREAPASAAAGHPRPGPGARIRYFGEVWTVVAIYSHPLFGEFWRLESEESGRYDLISAKGSDGNYELLETVA